MRVLLAAAFCAFCAGQSPADVANAELAFAKLASEKGISASFLANFAEGSMILNPEPTDARAHYAAEKDPGLLSWRPTSVGVSVSGDLAYSTGPWEYRVTKDAAPIVQGHFLSIWAKQPDGAWKVAFDCGVPHAALAESAGWHAFMPRNGGIPGTEFNINIESFDGSLSDGPSKLQHLAFGAVVYRSKSLPLKDRDEVAKALTGEPSKSYIAQGSIASKAADLACTWGVATGAADRVSYCHVWVRPSGVWQLLYDLELPLPAKP